jgi:hypothetical protein
MEHLPHSLFRDTGNTDYLIQNYSLLLLLQLYSYVRSRRLVSHHILINRWIVYNHHSQYYNHHSQ